MKKLKESILSIAEICIGGDIGEIRRYNLEALTECRKEEKDLIAAKVLAEFSRRQYDNAFGGYCALHVLTGSLVRNGLLDNSEQKEIEDYLNSLYQAMNRAKEPLDLWKAYTLF